MILWLNEKKQRERREEKASFVLMLVNFFFFYYLSMFQDTEMGYVLLPLGSRAVGLKRFLTSFQADRVLVQVQTPYSPYFNYVCTGPTHMLGREVKVDGAVRGWGLRY